MMNLKSGDNNSKCVRSDLLFVHSPTCQTNRLQLYAAVAMRLFRIPNKINKIVIFHLERYK